MIDKYSTRPYCSLAHYLRYALITVSLSGNVFYWGITPTYEIKAEHGARSMRKMVHEAHQMNTQIAFMYY